MRIKVHYISIFYNSINKISEVYIFTYYIIINYSSIRYIRTSNIRFTPSIINRC